MTKLYTGENAKYLVGDQKIPEYLSIFLANMNKSLDTFKINCVRQLRMSTERLQDLCNQIPRSVFYYLQFKYQSIIKSQITKEQSHFDHAKEQDQTQKDEHLRLFRPKLENPANK